MITASETITDISNRLVAMYTTLKYVTPMHYRQIFVSYCSAQFRSSTSISIKTSHNILLVMGSI